MPGVWKFVLPPIQTRDEAITVALNALGETLLLWFAACYMWRREEGGGWWYVGEHMIIPALLLSISGACLESFATHPNTPPDSLWRYIILLVRLGWLMGTVLIGGLAAEVTLDLLGFRTNLTAEMAARSAAFTTVAATPFLTGIISFEVDGTPSYRVMVSASAVTTVALILKAIIHGI